MDLPANIVIEKLRGPVRGKPPVLYYRDEEVWSPDRTHFALAYTICEASMCNEVGCLLWGELQGSRGVVQQNLTQVVVCCWRSPWCRWLDEDVFVFKAQRYSLKRRLTCVPLVVAHATKGFRVLPGTNDANHWLDRVQAYSEGAWAPWDEQTLANMVEAST